MAGAEEFTEGRHLPKKKKSNKLKNMSNKLERRTKEFEFG